MNYIKLSEVIIKIVGIVFIAVGFALLLTVVGLNFFGLTVPFGIFGSIIGGVLFLAAGIYLVRGGTINL